MRIFAIVLFLLVAAGPAHAAQHWGCTPGNTWSGLVRPALWLSISSQSTGVVQIDGRDIETTYAQTGLNRTWYWNPNDEGLHEYSVSLRGDGVALFFNYSLVEAGADEDDRPPPEMFTCREFSPKSRQEIQKLFE